MNESFNGLEFRIETAPQQAVVDALNIIENCGVVVWGTQATMDYKYKVNEEIIANVAKDYFSRFREKILKLKGGNEILGVLNSLSNGTKLTSDIEIVLDGSILANEISKLKQEKKVGGKIIGEPIEEIGGSPTISAVVSFLLGENEKVAKTVYAGTYPKSVQDHVEEKEPSLAPLFDTGIKNNYTPGSLCFEVGKFKLMIANSDGRKLEDMLAGGEYQIDLNKIATQNKGTIAFAIGGLNKGKPEEYIELIKWVKGKNPDVVIFVGTNSFKKQIEARDYETVRAYFNVLRCADIVSMNEAELDQIYESVYNNKQLSRSNKLELLNLSGISIVHAADGAIANFGTQIRTTKTKKKLIEGILQLAVDGTSRYYETGGCLKALNQSIDYAKMVMDRRNTFSFYQMFDYNNSYRYMVGAIAPVVKGELAKGNITGLGATFDGYAMAIMTPLYNYFRKN